MMKKIYSILLVLVLSLSLPLSVYAESLIRSTQNKSPGPGSNVFTNSEIMLLKNQTKSQMMSYVITTSNGSLIVIDGGLPEDAEHLKQVIKSKGGHVSAWILTHPHSDHVGALTKIIEDNLNDIRIDAVYYNIVEQGWYDRNEAYRADMVARFREAMNAISPDVRHSNVKKGDILTIDNAVIHFLNEPYLFNVNAINNSSLAFRIDMEGKRILFLGDMGEQAGYRLLQDVGAFELKADLVQMAHHGQYGVSREVYQAIAPDIAMWNTPEWLWNNDNGGGTGSGSWLTLEVRSWMQALGVKRHYIIKDGDQIIK